MAKNKSGVRTPHIEIANILSEYGLEAVRKYTTPGLQCTVDSSVPLTGAKNPTAPIVRTGSTTFPLRSREISMKPRSLFEMVYAEIGLNSQLSQEMILYGYLLDSNWDVPDYVQYPERAAFRVMCCQPDPDSVGVISTFIDEPCKGNQEQLNDIADKDLKITLVGHIKLPEEHFMLARDLAIGFDPTRNGLDVTVTYADEVLLPGWYRHFDWDDNKRVPHQSPMRKIINFEITRRGCPQSHVMRVLEQPPAQGWKFWICGETDLAPFEDKGALNVPWGSQHL